MNALKYLKELARRRIAIEALDPEINAGRFAAKTVVGAPFQVSADLFGEGHDVVAAAVLTWADGEKAETETPMQHVVNDRWTAEVVFPENRGYRYTIIAWNDLFGSWSRDTRKKRDAGQPVDVELQEARLLIDRCKPNAQDKASWKSLRNEVRKSDDPISLLLSYPAQELLARIGPRGNVTRYELDLPVWVDRERAAFSAWYELFPRSAGAPGTHGTLRDVTGRLDYVRDLGFDVLYFPPIHPIGKTNRKGRNNALEAGPDEVGSPYAIGSDAGGNLSVHPDLGTLKDFDALVAAARDKGLEIAMDIALNASPDHPWIDEHPDWFERRPDGTIKYAENPPKKYEDIVNFRYYLDDGKANAPFWHAIRDMFLHWIDHGVLCFRVDNPHTKPYPFWEWIIAEIRRDHPGAIFLSEAFTRPKVMKRLAKIGFNQSYSYFTWRNTKAEFTDYLTELTTEDCRHTMRPNFFTNTPDINPIFTQTSGRAGFRSRAVLAGTLTGNWGLYSGFELCEAAALPGREEYLDSEKYELRHRDWDAPGHIKDDVRLINRIRNDEPAMRIATNLEFFQAYHDEVLYYGRMDFAQNSFVLFHVLNDPRQGADFTFELPLWRFGLADDGALGVQDLINGNHFTWQGKYHTMSLDPEIRPYAVWKISPPNMVS